MKNNREIPDVFKSYINAQKTDNVEIMEIKKITSSLTHEQALEDLKTFRYIFDNAYSGREYWENKGLDFNKAYENIQNFIDSHDKVTKGDMLEMYKQSLNGIHDGHLGLMTYYNNISFGQKYKAYFADVLLEKTDDQYKVIASKAKGVSVGDTFSFEHLKGLLFKTLSPSGQEHYLLGMRSWDKIDNISFDTGEKIINIPVHACRASDYQREDVGIFKKSCVDGYNVVTSSRFWDSHEDDKTAKDIYDCGLLLRNEDTVIWNIMGNGGGNSNYPLQFIKGLNDYSYWKISGAVLNSPPVCASCDIPSDAIKNTREWTFAEGKERELDKGVFKGTLYVLSNDGVASSGESALNIARSVKNCVIVGQNSGGVGVFGDILTYQLPYSDIRLRVPYKLFLGGANEGEGFDPDIWVDKEDVLGELIKWLKNPKEYYSI